MCVVVVVILPNTYRGRDTEHTAAGLADFSGYPNCLAERISLEKIINAKYLFFCLVPGTPLTVLYTIQ